MAEFYHISRRIDDPYDYLNDSDSWYSDDPLEGLYD
jgi:hypothetical protein